MSDRRGKSDNMAVKRSLIVCCVNLILRMLRGGALKEEEDVNKRETRDVWQQR
jgi:hypothetical protein